MKIFTSVLVPLLVLSIVVVFVFQGCGTDVNRELSTKIRKRSRDGEISKSDFISLKQFIDKHKKEQVEFVNYLSSDSSLYLRIKKDAAGINVYFPVKIMPIKMGNINFYIETSGSMGGYMNGGTHFQDVGNILISSLQDYDSVGNVSYVRFKPNTIAAHITTYTDIPRYASDLTNTRFAIGGSSPLNKIFKVIIDSSNTNDINVFLTDGIMSGTDEEIRSNPDFNLRQREYMAGQIRDIFEKQKNKSWGMIIYAFGSNFNATSHWPYYTYNNNKKYNSFSNRPFYVFVFGHKQLLRKIKNKVEESKRLNIKEKSYFGMNTQKITDYVLFKSCFKDTKKNCMIRNSEIVCNTEPSESDIVEFAIGLNLANLPTYMRNLDYLNQNVKITDNNSVIAKVKVFKYPGEIQENLNRKELPAILNFGCTHYIEVKLTGFFVNETNLNIKILKENNSWYEDWSCDNDSDIATNSHEQKQTFNFKYLVQGIQDAYTTKGDATADINIHLINKH